ncbi:MAG: hypothetical protein C0391_09940, partial [Anaerolinea sp.]|nr:hypothetical protein [Anaerolinea sp.]
MNTYKWVMLVLIAFLIGVLALGFSLVNMVNQNISSALQPVVDLNADISTQIADILHPTPTIRPDPVTIIMAVKPLARLETIQYSVEKVITGETNQGLLKEFIGDRLLFIAHGTVIAGIDLSKIDLEQVVEKDNRIILDLPEPEVFIASLDNQQSYIYDRETGIFSRGNPELETEVRRAAEVE